MKILGNFLMRGFKTPLFFCHACGSVVVVKYAQKHVDYHAYLMANETLLKTVIARRTEGGPAEGLSSIRFETDMEPLK